MRIAVVGPGAMGCVFAGRLAAAGEDALLVARTEERARGLERDGVVLIEDGHQRHVRVPATAEVTSAGRIDAFLFVVKARHTRAAIEAVSPAVGPDTVIATLQNGIGASDVLADAFGGEHVVLGASNESATVVAPGVVEHPGSAPTFLGPCRGASVEDASRLAAPMRRAGLDVRVTAEIGQELWRKLAFVAAALPAAALAGMTNGEAMGHAGVRAVIDAAAREAVAVARTEGYELDAQERVDYIQALLTEAPSAKLSMVQDIEAGRPTEIDFITGALVAVADRHGVEVPVNRTLWALVNGWEAARGFGQ